MINIKELQKISDYFLFFKGDREEHQTLEEAIKWLKHLNAIIELAGEDFIVLPSSFCGHTIQIDDNGTGMLIKESDLAHQIYDRIMNKVIEDRRAQVLPFSGDPTADAYVDGVLDALKIVKEYL